MTSSQPFRIMIKKGIEYIKKIAKDDARVNLGRWNVDYCNKKTNIKIDSSNTDHCGTCGTHETHIPYKK